MTGTESYTFQDFQQDGTTPGGSGTLVQSLYDSANYSLNRVHTQGLRARYIVTDITVAPGATAASNDVTVVFNNGKYQSRRIVPDHRPSRQRGDALGDPGRGRQRAGRRVLRPAVGLGQRRPRR